MIMKFMQRLENSDVRELCINYEFYTCGNNDQYEMMFSKVDKFNADMTPENLMSIAQDIKCHSDTDKTEEDIAHFLFHRIGHWIED